MIFLARQQAAAHSFTFFKSFDVGIVVRTLRYLRSLSRGDRGQHVLVEHQALCPEVLRHARHHLDMGRVVLVALLNREPRIAGAQPCHETDSQDSHELAQCVALERLGIAR